LFFVHIAKSYAFVQRIDLGIVANSASHVYTHPALSANPLSLSKRLRIQLFNFKSHPKPLSKNVKLLILLATLALTTLVSAGGKTPKGKY
jgi:hypothetical protein